MKMDVKAVIAMEVRLNANHRGICSEKLFQNILPLVSLHRASFVILPAQLFCFQLRLLGEVFVTACIRSRASDNIYRIHFV